MYALILSLLVLGQAGVPDSEAVSSRLVVTEEGARIVTEHSCGPQSIELDDLLSPGRQVTDPRWAYSDEGLGWICKSIAVGDSGAALISGLGLNNQNVTLHTSGSATPVFVFNAFNSHYPQVAMAARAPLAAATVIFDIDPDPGIFEYEVTLHVFDTTGGGLPLWSYTFPLAANSFGSRVAVSDDGSVVLACQANNHTERLMIEAFTGDGTPISSGQLYVQELGTPYNHSRQVRLSADGTRAYFIIASKVMIYDVFNAKVIFRTNAGGTFDSHDMSDDGRRFAFGDFGQFSVFEEAQGSWKMIASKAFSTDTYIAWLDLNADGSRLGWQQQFYKPENDRIDFGIFDVDAGVDLFTASYAAPGTQYSLTASGCKLDAAGEYIACGSWGDSFNLTPEAFVYDAAGNMVCEVDVRGSVYAVDLDDDGDVFVIGNKAVHANAWGNGGDVQVIDVCEQELHVLGYPQLGGTLEIQAAPTGQNVLVAVCDSLGVSSSPYGDTLVDLGTLLKTLGPMAIPPAGLSESINVPSNPALAGNDVHFQALITGGGSDHLTNKVSLRLLP